MKETSDNMVVCSVCGQQKKRDEAVPAEAIRPSIGGLIRRAYPEWSHAGYVCINDLNRFRSEYVRSVIEEDKGKLDELEEQVVKSLSEQELLSENVNEEYEQQITASERLADRIADLGGSWRFIGIFTVVLVVWIAVNSLQALWMPFDPYPYIFLNLILSCLAALQAPVIMMSQNRQEARDRLRAEHDYRVNLKAEVEIRNLHEKIDYLLAHQWQRLLEIQGIQMELMEELNHKKPGQEISRP
ncbi:MAG TPA: DUF1003 domain-containing protein [Dissulfurispiraceae bacterium]|nr:DUF1003 domain-containing protein [Dissulfurispiraceae bacterium]